MSLGEDSATSLPLLDVLPVDDWVAETSSGASLGWKTISLDPLKNAETFLHFFKFLRNSQKAETFL